MTTILNNEIETFLNAKNIKPFWVATTISWVGKVMAGNNYFVTSISNPKLTARLGRVVRFEFDATATIPDSNANQTARVAYAFNPSAKVAHKVKISTK